MLSSIALLIVLTVLVMIIHSVNIATAIWVVKCHEKDFVKTKNVLKLTDPDTLRIWFISFAVLVSVGSILVCAQNIVTIGSLSVDRVELAIRAYCLRLAEAVMILNYHYLMLLECRNRHKEGTC